MSDSPTAPSSLLDGQRRVLEMIVRGEPIAAVLAALCGIVEAQSPDARAAILLVDESGTRLGRGIGPSLPDAYHAELDDVPIDASVGTCAAAAATRSTVVTTNIEHDPGWRGLAHLPLALGLRAAWSMPIAAPDGRVIATFGTYFRESRGPTDAERRLVEVLAQTAALAIERQRTDEAVREAARRDRFLANLASETQALVEPEAVMEAAARMLAEHLDVDRCAYAEVADEREFVITGDHPRRGAISIVGRWPVAAFGPACVEAMRAGVPYVVEDSETDPRIDADFRAAYRATQIRAVVCVPLHKAQVFTAAMAVHARQVRRWTSAEIELVSLVVARCWEALQRMAAAHQLHESRARLDYAVRLSGIGFWYCDLPFEELEWDMRVREHFFLPAAGKVTIDTFYERMHPDDREPTRQAIASSIATRTPYDVVYRTQDPTRTRTKWIRALGGTAYDAEGHPIRFDGVTVDVTNEKLDRAQLAQLLDRLREQDRRKDEFLATLAHELRNPLAPIVTGLDLLGRTEDEALQARMRGIMGRQLKHLVRLVDDLLDLSRITLGKVRLELSRLDLRDAIDQAVALAKPALAAQSQVFTLSVPDEPLPLLGDATRLSQVVANLLNNAAKYTPAGGHVSLTVRRVDDHAVIEVADDGIGIESEWLPRVFELFAQVAPSAGASQGGLGIGLTLVRRLVELHDGAVTVASEGLGRGSTFTVRLPLATPGEKPVSTPDLSTSATDVLRILVVDDNEDAAQSLRMLLEFDGHAVEVAKDGRGALAAAQVGQHALVLLDIGLPDMSGYDVCRELRTRFGDRPVIAALTGWGASEDRRRAHEAGFDEHLVKPIDAARLTALVERVARAR